ncbi:MAG: hypothetical protein R3F62_06520 [Planctomycetota bacterium]
MELRCAYCHDVGGRLWECAGCLSVQHPACWDESRDCATVGCDQQPSAWTRCGYLGEFLIGVALLLAAAIGDPRPRPRDVSSFGGGAPYPGCSWVEPTPAYYDLDGVVRGEVSADRAAVPLPVLPPLGDTAGPAAPTPPRKTPLRVPESRVTPRGVGFGRRSEAEDEPLELA